MRVVFVFLFLSACVSILNAETFPVVRMNMSGNGYGIVAGSTIQSVDLIFKNIDDEWAFEALRPEIKLAGLSLLKTGPKIFIEGTLNEDRDEVTVENWFILTPFHEINSLVEGVFDESKTIIREYLEESDFSHRALVTIDGLSVEIEKPNNITFSNYYRDFQK